MVLEIILYTLGVYMIAKSLIILTLKKPIKSWVEKLLKNKKAINCLAILEIVLGLILIVLGYFVA